MKRLLFVYNPTSGKGAITGNVTTIVDAFTKAGWLVTIYPTQGTGDATRVTRELAPQFDRVVCCGGDGTLSETAAGLLALPQPPLLGYIPSGSTNDCAATHRLPQGNKPAEELAADPMVRKVYLGQHFELKKSHQLTQEMKNRKGQEVNE